MTVASASVLFRDLRDILTNLMQLGFFVTPIIYLIDKIASRPFRALLRLNPMTPFVVSYQDVLFFGHVPGLADTLLMIAYAFVSVAIGSRCSTGCGTRWRRRSRMTDYAIAPRPTSPSRTACGDAARSSRRSRARCSSAIWR